MPRYEYTPREYAEMHFIYGEARGNARAAARLYRERYPNRDRHPDYRVFIRVHNALLDGRILGTGVGGASEGRPPQVNDEIIIREIEEDSSVSIRVIAQRTGIPRSTVHRVLKRYRYHPYHVQRVQTLTSRDYPQRVAFCQRMLRMIRADPQFFNKILWSDESSCRRDGYLNLHNLHSWQLVNPHLMREDRSQHQFKINLWAGIINGQIIGPFELPATLNAEYYLHFLRNELPTLLENVPEDVRQAMWLQNDGCPAHYATAVRAQLDETYPNRWIGRLGPILWPPRSPDLNPLDFLYWGCLKDRVYKQRITTEEELRQRIQSAVSEINESHFARRIRASFIRRCRLCILVGGRQFEHLL
ncbi:hypothetical protein PYW07_006231 [Mythimna separata]|uniref:Transposase n=1 Tax=Mythimna separata TaxID=271217 RepID=A0AAD7YWA1_MYTSE|nr:hypothetical protein PYW07_006231 [Mythimna separata]